MRKKYLSIVTTSRNDDHSADLRQRMKLFVSSLMKGLEKYNLSSELVIVEWNPPKNNATLKSLFKDQPKTKYSKIRIITVPARIHNSYPYSKKLRLYQFIAKNVGIRRARGEYILATNMDILFSDKLVKFLSEKKLQKDKLYRAVRFDIPSTVLEKKHDCNIDNFARKSSFRVFYPWSTVSVENPKRNIFYKRFTKIRNTFHLYKFLIEGKLFTNACGDFTLLHRNKWSDLKGYPEFPYYGVKIDGLICWQAIISGIKQEILPFDNCVYHIDHPESWSADNSFKKQRNLEKNKIPFLSTDRYNEYIQEMKTKQRPVIINNTNWGLSNIDFKEIMN